MIKCTKSSYDGIDDAGALLGRNSKIAAELVCEDGTGKQQLLQIAAPPGGEHDAGCRFPQLLAALPTAQTE